MNKPITAAEIDAAKKEGKRVVVSHQFPNRAKRREKTDVLQSTNKVHKAHGNNRPMNKARKNNKLFLKLAEFEMSMLGRRR